MTLKPRRQKFPFDDSLIESKDPKDISLYVKRLVTTLYRMYDNIYKAFIAEGWNVPSLANSWVNYDSTYTPIGYYIGVSKIVYIRGCIKSGSADTIFTLPSGYRPDYRHSFTVTENASLARVDVLADGTVQRIVGGNTQLWLDDIYFRV